MDKGRKVVLEREIKKVPFIWSQKNALKGTWKIKVSVQKANLMNFPYVICVGFK